MDDSVQNSQPEAPLTSNNDIVNERYRGPSASIASLGYGFIDFKLATVFSLVTGFALSSTKSIREFTVSTLDHLGSGAKTWKDSSNLFKKSVGWTGHQWLEAGHWAQTHIPFGKTIERQLEKFEYSKTMWTPLSRITGMLLTLGFVLTGFTGIQRGVKRAHEGRDQFEHAKSEIKDLRAENNVLRNKNAEMRVTQQIDADIATNTFKRDLPIDADEVQKPKPHNEPKPEPQTSGEKPAPTIQATADLAPEATLAATPKRELASS